MKKILLILIMFTALDAGKEKGRWSSKRLSDSELGDMQAQQASYDELASRLAAVEKNVESLTPAEKAATCFIHEVWGKKYVKVAILLFIFMKSRVILANGQSIFSTVMSNMRKDGYISQIFLDIIDIFNVSKDDPIGALALLKDWMLENKVLIIGCSWILITIVRLFYLSSKERECGIIEASGLSDFRHASHKISNKIMGFNGRHA